MPVRCPTCRAPHPTPHPLAGAELVCGQCAEPFTVPDAPAAEPGPRKIAARGDGWKDEGIAGARVARHDTRILRRLGIIVSAGAVLLLLTVVAILVFLAPMWK